MSRTPNDVTHQIIGMDVWKSGLDPKKKRGEQPNQGDIR